jgi:hypothetical protein
MEFPHRSHTYYVHILYTRLEETYRYLFHIYTNAAELRGIYDNFLLTEEERNRREVAIMTDPQLVWSTFRGQKESSPRKKPH